MRTGWTGTVGPVVLVSVRWNRGCVGGRNQLRRDVRCAAIAVAGHRLAARSVPWTTGPRPLANRFCRGTSFLAMSNRFAALATLLLSIAGSTVLGGVTGCRGDRPVSGDVT